VLEVHELRTVRQRRGSDKPKLHAAVVVNRCDEHLRCVAAELAQPGVEFGGPVALLGGVKDLPALLGGPDDAEATSQRGPGVPRSVGRCLVGKDLVGSRLNWAV